MAPYSVSLKRLINYNDAQLITQQLRRRIEWDDDGALSERQAKVKQMRMLQVNTAMALIVYDLGCYHRIWMAQKSF